MKNKKPILLLGLLAAFGAVWFFSRRSAPPAATVSPNVSTPVVTAKSTKLLATDDLERDIGLKKVPFSGKTLVVSVDAKLRCGVGDMDAIRIDLEHSDSRRLLLSLEGVLPNGDTFRPLVRGVTYEELLKGLTERFALPGAATGAQLGLYLCKDSQQEGKCQKKPFADINNIFRIYAFPNHPDAPKVAPDKIYFFQYVLVKDKSLAMFDTLKPPPNAYRKLALYANRQLGADPVVASDAASQVGSLNKALRSIPLDTPSESDVQIVLPKFDKSVCPK